MAEAAACFVTYLEPDSGQDDLGDHYRRMIELSPAAGKTTPMQKCLLLVVAMSSVVLKTAPGRSGILQDRIPGFAVHAFNFEAEEN